MDDSGRIRGQNFARAIDAAAGRRATDLDALEGRPDVKRTDDEDASDARHRYRSHGIEPLAPDPAIGPLLEPDEDVLAKHQSVGLDRRQRSRPGTSAPVRGDLYVTSARLVHVGPSVVTIQLDDIEDAALIGDRVLAVTRGGLGVAFETDRPRLLRVQMAAARVARTGLIRPRSGRSQLATR